MCLESGLLFQFLICFFACFTINERHYSFSDRRKVDDVKSVQLCCNSADLILGIQECFHDYGIKVFSRTFPDY